MIVFLSFASLASKSITLVIGSFSSVLNDISAELGFICASILEIAPLADSGPSLSDELSNDLTNIGHKIMIRKTLGRMDCILVREDGSFEGGADKRGDNVALGY